MHQKKLLCFREDPEEPKTKRPLSAHPDGLNNTRRDAQNDGSCIEQLKDEVLTFLNVRSQQVCNPCSHLGPSLQRHCLQRKKKKRKTEAPGNGRTKIKIKRNPDRRLFHYKTLTGSHKVNQVSILKLKCFDAFSCLKQL